MMKEALLCHAQMLFQPWGTHHEGRAIVHSLRRSLALKETAHNQNGTHFLLTCPRHTCYFFRTLSASIPFQSWSEMAWREKGIWGELMQSPQMTQLLPRIFFFFLLSATNVPLMSHLKSHLWYGFSWSSKLQLTEMFPLCSWVILAYSLHLVLGHVFSSDV